MIPILYSHNKINTSPHELQVLEIDPRGCFSLVRQQVYKYSNIQLNLNEIIYVYIKVKVVNE